MAIIEMKCPNCGGQMQLVNNQFTCPNCRTMMLNIVDAKIDTDVTVMSPDEFAKKIEESKRQFVVNINDNIKVFDVDILVINKRIKDATIALEKRKFFEVFQILNPLQHDILSVERLRLLAEYNVINEYELSLCKKYIDKNKYYLNIVSLADEQTKATYIKLADYCREQCDIKKEIDEIGKLFTVRLYQEALAYAKEMCRKYPQTALSWMSVCEAKCHLGRDYNFDLEFSMMEKCPDYSESGAINGWRMEFQRRIRCFVNVAYPYSKNYGRKTKRLGHIVCCIWAAILLIGIGVSLLLYTKIKDAGYICLLAGIPAVVAIWLSFKSDDKYPWCWCYDFDSYCENALEECSYCTYDGKTLKEKYDLLFQLVPESIRERYGAKCEKKKRKFYIYAIIAGWIIFAFGIATIILLLQ